MNSQGKDLGGLLIKQLKEFIQLDQEDTDKASETELSIQIDKLKRWLELNENLDADNLFKNRVPLGMIIPSMSKIDFCVGIKNENNPERPLINTIVLIYDEKYNEIYSGIITNIKSVKNPKISAIGRNINANTKGNRVKGANNSAPSSSKKKSAKKGPAKNTNTNTNTNNTNNVNNADNKGANLSTSSNIGRASILFSIQLYFKHDVNFKNYYRVTSIMSDMSYVFTANADEIKKVYGLPEEGVNLGVCTQNGELIETSQGFLYYYLDPELLKTHLCIGGLTGRGKTIFLKNLIFDVTKKEFTPRVHSIIFDLQGDLVQLMKKMPNNLIPKKYRNLYEKFNLEPQGLEDILINEEILFLKPFYIRAEGFLKIFPWKNFGLRSYRITTGEELVSLMPLLTDLAKATLISLFNFFMNNVTHFHFETFYQWVLNNKKIERKTKYVWYMPETNETVSANISTGDSMLRALEQLRSLHIFDVYDEIDIKEMLKKKIVFIYFPRAKGYTLVRSMFLLQILKLIYEYKVHRRSGLFYTFKKSDKKELKDQGKNITTGRMKPIPEKELDKIRNNSLSQSKDLADGRDNKSKGSLDNTYNEGKDNGVDLIKKVNSHIINHLIVIDEAHELLPARSKNSQLSSSFFNYIEKEFKNIAKEGRKYGIWLVISTQLLSELNNVVVVNAQTKVLFEISGDDEKKINSDRMLRDILKDLKQGEAVVYNRDNLKLSKFTQIRVIPPVFLHCDPPQADIIYQHEIEEVLKMRKKMGASPDVSEVLGEDINAVENEPLPVLDTIPGLKNGPGDNNADKEGLGNGGISPELAKQQEISKKQKLKIDELLKQLSPGNIIKNRVTNLYGKSILNTEIDVLVKALKDAATNSGLYGQHLEIVLQDLAVALQSDEVIGINLVGPSGEGKSRLAFMIVNELCFGGTKAFYAVSESTMEEDLFFGINPKVMVDKDVPDYTLGVICQSLIERTFPILDEANRAPERIYGGKALTALADGRYVMFPGNKLIEAPRDWKIIFIMNPVDLGTFSFPIALQNRLTTIKVPYADDDAARNVLNKILKDFPDVVDAFVSLRHNTMKVSPLPIEYHYIPKSEKVEDPDVQLHGISMRITDRFAKQFLKYNEMLKDKKEAFIRAVKVNCGSIFVNNIPEEHEYFDKLIQLELVKLQN